MFFGSVTGGAAFTGPGTKHFEANVPALGAVQKSTNRQRKCLDCFRGRSAGTSAVDTLAIADAGLLDLADHAMVVRSGDVAQLTAWVRRGLAGGGGIVSSLADNAHGIGVIGNGDSDAPMYGSFEGIASLTGGEALVRFTLLGDGDVGTNDLARARRALGGRRDDWLSGDFDYDGRTTARDIALLRRNLGLSMPLSSQATTGAVPEPAACAALLPAGGALALRRRRSADRRGVTSAASLGTGPSSCSSPTR